MEAIRANMNDAFIQLNLDHKSSSLHRGVVFTFNAQFQYKFKR